MVYCRIENCNHRTRTRGKSNPKSLAWELLGICACCALELFPNGYKPERGRNIVFHHSNQCKAITREELEKLATEERRKKQ